MVLCKEVTFSAVLQDAGIHTYAAKGQHMQHAQRYTSEIVRLPPSSRACLLETTSMPLYMQSKWTCSQT